MDQNDPLSTARRLAAEYKIGEATIKRDERFAAALKWVKDPSSRWRWATSCPLQLGA
jgi:hypothetical protein